MPNITKGANLAKLLWYLYSRGAVDEHTNPHVVAGYEDPVLLEPPRGPSGEVDVRPLAADLEAPVTVARASGRKIPPEWVWHCSLSLGPSEGTLTDQRWQQIAEAFVAEMGFSDCRWVAVRHGLSAGGNDHIHLVTTRFDEDGRRVSWHDDFSRAQQAAARLEEKFGLPRVAVRDGVTSREDVTKAEAAIARKNGRPIPDRVLLRKQVRAVARDPSVRSEVDFAARLCARGLLVRTRVDAHDPSKVTGYAVALGDGDQVTWYGGGRLDGDLTLPKLRNRWTGEATAGEWDRVIAAAAAGGPVSPPSDSPPVGWSTAAAAAASTARQAAGLRDPADASMVADAVVDMAARLAEVTEPGTVGGVSRAVDALARAAVPSQGRVLGGGSPQAVAVARSLRSLAAAMAAAGRPASRDAIMAVLAVIAATAQLAQAVASLQEAHRRTASAGAALAGQAHLAGVLQAAADRGVSPPSAQSPAPAAGRVPGPATGGRHPDTDHRREQATGRARGGGSGGGDRGGQESHPGPGRRGDRFEDQTGRDSGHRGKDGERE